MAAIEEAADQALADLGRLQEARALDRLRYGPAPDAPIVVQLCDGSLACWPSGEPFDPEAYGSPFAPFFEEFSGEVTRGHWSWP